MAKTRITQKELPYLNRDLDLSPAVLKKVVALQAEHQAKFDRTLEATKKEALTRYTQKLEALNKAKAEVTKQYDAEIKKIKEVIANIKGDTKPDTPIIRSSTKKATGSTTGKTAKKATGKDSTESK